MTPVRGHGRFRIKYSFETFFDSFLSFEMNDELFNQLAKLLRANFSIVFSRVISFLVPKYVEKDLQ